MKGISISIRIAGDDKDADGVGEKTGIVSMKCDDSDYVYGPVIRPVGGILLEDLVTRYEAGLVYFNAAEKEKKAAPDDEGKKQAVKPVTPVKTKARRVKVREKITDVQGGREKVKEGAEHKEPGATAGRVKGKKKGFEQGLLF